MKSIVPITRFNRGEANKIFDEVHEAGVKIVLKNNSPACVLVNPERYEAMVDALEDYALYFEAEKRVTAAGGNFIPAETVMTSLDISKSDLGDVEVEIE